MSGEIELIGDKELRKVLEKLPEKVDVRLLNAAGRRAMKPFVKSARRKAPSRTGNLRKSIGTRAMRPVNGVSTIVGGPRTGKRQKYDAWYSHFVEFGTKGVVRYNTKRYKKGQRYKSDSKAKPFIRPAYDQEKANMMKEYEKEVAFVTQKYLEKQAAKMKK